MDQYCLIELTDLWDSHEFEKYLWDSSRSTLNYLVNVSLAKLDEDLWQLLSNSFILLVNCLVNSCHQMSNLLYDEVFNVLELLWLLSWESDQLYDTVSGILKVLIFAFKLWEKQTKQVWEMSSHMLYQLIWQLKLNPVHKSLHELWLEPQELILVFLSNIKLVLIYSLSPEVEYLLKDLRSNLIDKSEVSGS